LTVPQQVVPTPADAEPASTSTVRSAAGTPRLRLLDAGVRRGERWLFRHLDLTLHAGRLVAITGPSGAGKSSLLTSLGGALELSEGQLKHSPAGISPAWVFQDLRLVPQATLLANVLMARLGRHHWWRTLWSFPAEERRAALAQLDELEIRPLALRLARETSGGEQQRAAVARALFGQAPLLLADEPVANLNEALAARVLDRLRREARERHALVLCVLHHEEQVRQFTDAALRLSPEFEHGWKWEELT
jgi:ABC-type phosphate/phosphonate transport system ATPase subunit